MKTTKCQTNEVRQENARDQLKAMIQQQNKHYRCRDYLDIHGLETEVHDPLAWVAECAMVVTDAPLASAPPAFASLSPARAHQRCPSKSVASPIMVSKFHHSILGAIKPNTSSGPSVSGDTTGISVPPTEAACIIEWRHSMLHWAFSVADTYSLDHEVVAVAFHLLDRFLAAELQSALYNMEAPIDQEDFQLYAMVCLYIAIKALVPFRKLTVGCIIEMSQGFYKEQHITEAELEILEALGWHVNQPTVNDFCRLCLDLFPENPLDRDIVYASCRYLGERALEDVFFMAKPTSLVALATVLLAAQRCGITVDETQGFLANLQGIISLETSEFDAVYRRLEGLC